MSASEPELEPEPEPEPVSASEPAAASAFRQPLRSMWPRRTRAAWRRTSRGKFRGPWQEEPVVSSCTSSLARRTCRRGRTLRRYTSINISTCASGRSRAAVTVHDVARDRHAIDTHALSCKAGGLRGWLGLLHVGRSPLGHSFVGHDTRPGREVAPEAHLHLKAAGPGQMRRTPQAYGTYVRHPHPALSAVEPWQQGA